MNKRRFLFLALGICLGFGVVFFGKGWREKAVFFATQEVALRAILRSCKGDDTCRSAMRPAAEECSRIATQSKQEWIDQAVLVNCMQKKFYRQSCKGEARCLATIDENYDRCYALYYPPGVPPDDVPAAESLSLCLRGGM